MYIRKLLLLSFSIISISVSAQDFAGTWVGQFSSDLESVRRNSRFVIQLRQAGKAVWGMYTIGDSMSVKKADCACTISGKVGKKNKLAIQLYKERLVQSTISDDLCEVLTYLETAFLEKDNNLYLTGKWFGRLESKLRTDGAAGGFVVQKVSNNLAYDVDQYFNNLDKMIRKNNDGDTTYLKTRANQ